LLRRANETLMERRFRDKSIVELSLTTKHKGNLVIIRPIERNLSGDYYILDEEGNLRLMDSAGFIGKAIASKQKPGAND
jgi:hypothetical protein